MNDYNILFKLLFETTIVYTVMMSLEIPFFDWIIAQKRLVQILIVIKL